MPNFLAQSDDREWSKNGLQFLIRIDGSPLCVNNFLSVVHFLLENKTCACRLESIGKPHVSFNVTPEISTCYI